VSKFLLIGGYEEVIKIYDIKKKREVGVLDSHSGTVTAITGHQNFVFTGADDGTIKVWKTCDWALLQTLASVESVNNYIIILANNRH
jgi:protein MAK11